MGRTDRQGSIEVLPADRPLQILLVKHGDQWLARLPTAPGLEPRLSATVVHDERRVALAARMAALRNALVDLASRRQLLLADAKSRIAAGQYAEALQAIQQVRELPAAEDLVAATVVEAKKDLSGDDALLARLDAAAADMQQVLTAQFDAKEIDEVAAQLQQHTVGKERPK